MGGKSELDKAMREMDQRKVEKYVRDQGCEWHFNPPHASHFGSLGATDWDHPPCLKRHVSGARSIATHTRTSGDTNGRSCGDR